MSHVPAKRISEHLTDIVDTYLSINSTRPELLFPESFASSSSESYSDNWWDLKVREEIRKNVETNIKREAESGFTERSELKIDYTTFGELTSIVQDNWDAFSALFKNPKAFSKIMTSLNQLRGPMAHCCPLAEDEVVRLNLAVKDWFRLME